MKRKNNPFEQHQLAKQSCREVLITEYLDTLRDSKVGFKHVTGLAVMIAKYIEKHEGKPCSRSTLLRNFRYKTLLLSFLAEAKKRGTKGIKASSVESEQAQALVVASQLEASNLRRELARLKAYLHVLELKGVAQLTSITPNDEIERLQSKAHAMEMKFVRTCQSLLKVLNEMNQVLYIDQEQRRVIDRSRMRNNVVVDSKFAEPFFEWLMVNKGLAGHAN